MRIRTGYSFRAAVGMIDDVIAKIVECEYPVAPISDRSSTFGFVRWKKAALKAGLRPVFGVEIAVTNSVNAKKPIVDYWTFFAKDHLLPLHQLLYKATTQFRYEPMITYQQAMEAEGLVKLAGYRSLLCEFQPAADLYIGLAPSVPKGLVREASLAGHQFLACSDNKYPNKGDQILYEVVCGRNASTQTYPQWILNEEEWRASLAWKADPALIDKAWANFLGLGDALQADLQKGQLLVPEKPVSLENLCIEGAAKLGVDLTDEVYSARLKKELDLIELKKFEDYFFIISDLMKFARANLLCGPARGSSCGSLVCYLTEITTVDPLKYDLIFERFIDITRFDLPDIDLDFSDTHRQLVFDYAAKKYGPERVARLGTVALYKPRSAIQETGAALQVPRWKCDAMLDSIIERSSGDSRAMQTMEDTFQQTQAGQELIRDHPNMIVAARMEGHPRHGSQHAAGIVLTEKPVMEYVALDARTGATYIDKKDAEELALLKIDALGLTQLSVFEDALEMAGLPRLFLESIPLDDKDAFRVINKGHFSGIFQFNGMALQSISRQITITCIDDIIAVTALGRPGPLASGGTNTWVKRKNGVEAVSYPHPCFEPYLNKTLGIVIYQEQILEIGRNIGNLSWEDVTQLRKAMSKSLGKEFFDRYGNPWKAGAIEKGVAPEMATKVWDELCAYGAWCLSGETELRDPNGLKPFTLKEMYDRNGIDIFGKKQKLYMYTTARMEAAPVISVICSGEKETYEVRTLNGRVIRATLDHRFFTGYTAGSRDFTKLRNLIPGAMVICARETSDFNLDQIIVDIDIIEFIGNPRIEMTYDIEMPFPYNNFLANDFIVHNSFNKSHAVAYGLISYYCCYLKAHHPFEFAAATLTHENDPAKQIILLREMQQEGYDYVPVDINISIDRWTAGLREGKKVLVGPVQNVKGIGPKLVSSIVSSRLRNEPLPARAAKLLANPVTPIDSLWPIKDAFKRILPDPAARNIFTQPTSINKIDAAGPAAEFLVFCVITKIAPRDENEEVNLARRGGKRVEGATTSLNMFIADDTDQTFAKIQRWDYERIGKDIVERGRAGKALYAMKGSIRGNSTFRMLTVKSVRYIGDLEGSKDENKVT